MASWAPRMAPSRAKFSNARTGSLKSNSRCGSCKGLSSRPRALARVEGPCVSAQKRKGGPHRPPIPLRIEKLEAVHQTGGDPDVVLQSHAAGTQHHPVELSSANR